MATELEELIGFLSHPSPPIKKAAVNIVRDYTGSEEGIQSLGKYFAVAVPSLFLILAERKEVSEPAAEALVNLSQVPDLAGKMIEMGIIKIVMDILYKLECDIKHLLVMLIVNLTQLDVGIESLLQNGDEKMQGLYVMKLVRSFCTSSSEKKGDDPFEHVASILVNISQKEAGRKLLLDPKRGLLKQIIRQFDSPSPLRKKGVSGTIRNCCFEAENQLQNLLLTSEFLWPALLLPVAGNKIYNEQDTSKMPLELGSALSIEREAVTDPEIRVQVLDAIYLLVLQGESCIRPSDWSRSVVPIPTPENYKDADKYLNPVHPEAGRRAFWSINGPRILQVGYEDEEDPRVMEAFERVGSLLIQESGEDTASTQAS